jgi:RHS repeat-associated protein
MQDGWVTAGYNALNQPMYIWSGNVGWTYFGYDGLGRCVKRWNDAGSVAYMYYDGWDLIQDGPQSSIADRVYVHGARTDEVVAQITPANNWIRYFHYDVNGNCTLQTDGWGNLVEQYDYDAFGFPYFYDAWGNNIGYSPWGNRMLFTGREWLSDLKLYDYRNRLYNPELGRFMQPDPKEFAAGDYNLYRYCHNDPVNKNDPTGLDAILNGDGTTYHFIVRPELSLRNLAGTQVTHQNPRFSEQCATGGQFLTGTNIHGRIHDAPATRTWSQGNAVSRNTPRGTLIARGWEHGAYPNRPAGDYGKNEVPNHVGIYLGAGDRAGTIKVFDQSAGQRGVLAVRQYPANQGWSVVNSHDQYDDRRSDAAVRAFREQREPIGGGKP